MGKNTGYVRNSRQTGWRVWDDMTFDLIQTGIFVGRLSDKTLVTFEIAWEKDPRSAGVVKNLTCGDVKCEFTHKNNLTMIVERKYNKFLHLVYGPIVLPAGVGREEVKEEKDRG